MFEETVETLRLFKNWVFRSRVESVESVESPVALSPRSVVPIRHAHPDQKFDHKNLFTATSFELIPFIRLYVLNHNVYVAVNELATAAAAAVLHISSRPDGLEMNRNHPLLDLVGQWGEPNRDQDSFEFMEKHFQNLLIAGNSYWLWESSNGGPPDTVRHLEPENVRIVPGAEEVVGQYIYRHNGKDTPYEPVQITHFKRANSFSRYYGLPAMLALFALAMGDNKMLEWNNDWFDDELGIPTGIVVVPSDMPDEEFQRSKDEFVARHGEKRRVAFIKSDAGKAVWLEAGAKHKDYDFLDGRVFNRKAIFEVVGLPLGVMAETSTEAHAIISQIRFMRAVWYWLMRTSRKLNAGAMGFWPQSLKWQAAFEDVRKQAVDWRREKLRRESDEKILTIDEMRMREYQLPPITDATAHQENQVKVTEKIGDTSDGDESGST